MLKTTFPKSQPEIPEAEELPRSLPPGSLSQRVRAAVVYTAGSGWRIQPPREGQAQEEGQAGPGPKAVTSPVLKGRRRGLQEGRAAGAHDLRE